MRSWTEARLVPHGKWRCLTRKTSLSTVVSRVYCFQTNDSCMTAGRWDPMDCYHTLCLWAAIRWVPATPTSRTLSLTHSVAAHLSGLWVTLWQMWHQFHFGGAASYRYFLHNRKCRSGKEKKKGDEKLAGLGRRQGFLKGLSPSQCDSDGNNLLYKGATSLHRRGCDEISSGSSVVKMKSPNETSRDVGPAFDIAPCSYSSFTHFLDLGYSLWSGDYK